MVDFTPSEVRQLIAEHRALLEDVPRMAGDVKAAEDKVKTMIDRLSGAQGLGSGLIKLRADDRSPEAQALLAGLQAYEDMLRAYEPVKQQDSRCRGKIEQAVEDAGTISGGLKRLFKSAAAKGKANESCQYLKSLLESDYARTLKTAKTQIAETMQRAGRQKSFTDAEIKKLRAAVERVCPGKLYPNDYPENMTGLIRDSDNLLRMINGLPASDAVYKENIRSSAHKLQQRETVKQLATLPVDEINRDKLGIRVSLLKDNGYATVADVCAASAYRLEYIRGISMDSAAQIMRIADAIAEDVGKNCRIRLSADDDSAESCELIRNIAAYLSYTKANEQYRASVNNIWRELSSKLAPLRPVASPMEWKQADAASKGNALKALRGLETLYRESARTLVYNAVSAFNEPATMTVQKAMERFGGDPVAFATVLEQLVPELCESGDAYFGLPEELAKQIEEQCYFPEGLKCTLRRYQEWGVKYILHQEKVLLGDEMGLGKTVQAIAAMVSLRNTKATHFMVVCPASVLTNWAKEIVRHSKLNVIQIYGPARRQALNEWLKRGGVAVTTYETTANIELDSNFRFSMLVVDEAHYIKNPEANRTANVIRISRNAQRLLFMTGTPLENNVNEMLALLRILQPRAALYAQEVSFTTSANEFRRRIAPVYYRRKRADVITELPELIENEDWCKLGAQEEHVYEQSILGKKYQEARRVSWSVGSWTQSCKAMRLKEIVEDAEEDGRKVLVFSFFLDTIKMVCDMFGRQAMPPINGSISPQRRQEIIDEFDRAKPGTVLPAQIQSGGTGLNIQSASVVVLCEPQFKPSIENQAVSRAHRMGQTRNVLVHRLLCENTVDEKLMQVLAEKQYLFNAFADESVAAQESMEIDSKTFGDIVMEEIERIQSKNGSSAPEVPAGKEQSSREKKNVSKAENSREEKTVSTAESGRPVIDAGSLIGKKVSHGILGRGTVVSCNKGLMTVSFEKGGEKKTFVYPDALGKFLTLEPEPAARGSVRASAAAK